MRDVIDLKAARLCACANLRRTDIVVTQFYDGILAPSGLYALQFGLLAMLAGLGPITLNRLAAALDTDRVTLSRHLNVLQQEGLICYEEERGQPTNRILLSQDGVQALENAWPFWQEAQERIENTLGRERFNAFLEELQAIRSILDANILRAER